jgi:COP9 signalosome complex subunit 2
MRLCKSLLESKKNGECEVLLDELHASCKLESGQDDPHKGGQLLEIYSIKIQLMAAANNRVALAELFERTNSLAADVNDPRSMSVIKECWGKMYASMNQWNEAYTNFYEAFRSYQDIGHANVKQCLKYVVIASMLSEEDTNPFASQEAAVFKSNNDIMPIANLLDAFDEDDIKRFERTLLQSRAAILGDEFIKEHLPAVKLRIRSKVLVKLIKPYTRVKLEWLCRQLNATMAEVENLVVNLILDNSINGRLDQIHSLLDLNYSEKADKLYGAMDAWISSVARLRNSISSRTGRSDFGGRGMGGGMAHFGGMMDFDDDLYGSQFGIGDSDFMQWMG